jgi:hypothetical protein
VTANPKDDSPAQIPTAKAATDKPALWAEGPSGGAVRISVAGTVPAQLLNGDELILLALKPSPWFVLLVSLRWVGLGILLVLVADRDFIPLRYQWYLRQAGVWLAAIRLAWAMLEWVSRQYVLTNRRVMRLRGVFEVDLFEASLMRIQSTVATFTLSERIFRVGTIRFETAGGGATWQIVAKPVEVHQKLCEAIRRAQNRGSNGV